MELGATVLPTSSSPSSSSSVLLPASHASSFAPCAILSPPYNMPSPPMKPCCHNSSSSSNSNSNSKIVSNSNISRTDQPQRAHCAQVFDNQDAAPPPSGTDLRTQQRELYDCVVVGAGISGLCAAQALITKHAYSLNRVLVTEARNRVGGNITTVHRGGYLWEEGPNSFQPTDPMLTLVVDNGLKDELVFGDQAAPRFVFWDGCLRAVPAGPLDLPHFDLMSVQGKIRAALGAIGVRPPPPGYEESVEQFVRRNLGTEVFERLIEPFCSGVYAGNPAKLSMKAAFGRVWKLEDTGGSIIGGTIKLIQEKNRSPLQVRDQRLPKIRGQTVGSFRRGLMSLPTAIAEKLGSSVKLNWKLESIQRLSKGGYELGYVTPEGLKSILTKSVLLTVPSYVASNILRPLSKNAADLLAKFYYPPVAAVTVSYPKSAIREDRLVNGELRGFGQLHPRNQGLETLGMIYSSGLFPNRAPQDRVLLSSYIGGSTSPKITEQGDMELVNQVDSDIRKMLIKPDAPQPEVLGVRVWPRAIPQFEVGHLDTLKDLQNELNKPGLEGLFLGGNYVVGVALSHCVEGAYECADCIAQYFKKAPLTL